MSITVLKKNSQVILPHRLINRMGLKPGDKFEIIEKDGGIFLVPIVVYPKRKIRKITKIVSKANRESKSNLTKIYNNVDEAFKNMGINFNEL
ncbi:AbrB/MazE/SpoVT family DNA-binding domain-containing protein [Caldicellulosiruptoraceae bacterium PP1]